MIFLAENGFVGFSNHFLWPFYDVTVTVALKTFFHSVDIPVINSRFFP